MYGFSLFYQILVNLSNVLRVFHDSI